MHGLCKTRQRLEFVWYLHFIILPFHSHCIIFTGHLHCQQNITLTFARSSYYITLTFAVSAKHYPDLPMVSALYFLDFACSMHDITFAWSLHDNTFTFGLLYPDLRIIYCCRNERESRSEGQLNPNSYSLRNEKKMTIFERT